MPDLSAALPTTDLEDAFLNVVDVEGKITAALENLGPMADHDVVVLDAGRGLRARLLAEIGARVKAVTFADPRDQSAVLDQMAALPAGQADAVVAAWSELASPDSEFIAAAQRLLRPCGRLLLVHDYGRDDVWELMPDRRDRAVEWSLRRGPFLGAGFRVRVIHCWWTFESIESAKELLVAGFGDAGVALADRLKKPRLEYQVAIYHRSVAPRSFDGDPANEEVGAAAG
jgi:hypothetical protein